MFWNALLLLASAACGFGRSTNNKNSDTRHVSTYMNPILPGWHPDPSCIFVPDRGDVFFCTTSTFLAFPGIPIFASRDLVNWRLVSHVLSRPDQVPGLANATEQSDGIYASTLRFHDGTFYLATGFLSGHNVPQILLFSSLNPYDDASWGDPIRVPVNNYGYDPDLFWDDDNQLYISFAAYNTTRDTEIIMATFNITTRKSGTWNTIWTGTGAPWAEGPHLYKKDRFYYLVIAEGGTGLNHSVTVARSTRVTGPYASYTGNPILTNNNTFDYFQTVGHADLFQDKSGNWWGVALATRSGPTWKTYPMGRETVLFPATWEKGDWPKLAPVNGIMKGRLPRKDRNPPGRGPLVDEGDNMDFPPGSTIPQHFLTWRPQPASHFTISPKGHPYTLRISPSRANLTGGSSFTAGIDSQAFISRLQSSTLFRFSVDVLFQPLHDEAEAGISIFLTQFQHIDLGIVQLRSRKNKLTTHFRLRAETSGLPNINPPQINVKAVPLSWLSQPITLRIAAPDDKTYKFTVAPALQPWNEIEIGQLSSEIVSGGTGKFTGKQALNTLIC
ncbi:arabinofuranosidase [Colletotrichum truncatum]|uniref:Arabinofuranosidase n=1 Tax=Colletotrichum truncatum TaxID=5467 RepID=A0ACC3YUQ8_COLTU|nr:arabinofuranosidase [Colletotrichum truncatum]KAF6785836.1 arabinofuranosidase [Colletotrichum truncatum]